MKQTLRFAIRHHDGMRNRQEHPIRFDGDQRVFRLGTGRNIPEHTSDCVCSYYPKDPRNTRNRQRPPLKGDAPACSDLVIQKRRMSDVS